MTNDLVDRAGTTFVFRLREDTGAAPADIARASVVARDVFDVRSLWADVEALDGAGRRPRRQNEMLLAVAADGRARRRAGCCARGRGRWTSRAERRALRRGRAGGRRSCCPACWSSPSRRRWRERVGAAHRAGRAGGARRPRRGAGRAVLRARHRRGRAARPSTRSRRSRALHFLLGGRLHLHWLRDRIALLAARHALGGDGARGAARRPLQPARGAHRRRRCATGALDAWRGGQPAGGRARAGDPGRDPRRRDVRPHDAAGRAARGAQPDRERRELGSVKSMLFGQEHTKRTRRPAARSATTGRARRRCC